MTMRKKKLCFETFTAKSDIEGMSEETLQMIHARPAALKIKQIVNKIKKSYVIRNELKFFP